MPGATILAYGEILWDLLPSGPMLGGAPFNFAYRASTLGAKPVFVSRLGRDALGQQAHDRAATLGMGTTWLQWDEAHPTGTVAVTFDERKVPTFAIAPDVAYDYIEMTDSLRARAAAADAVLFGTLIQRSETSRNTLGDLLELATGSLKVCDINLRRDCYCRQTIIDSLAAADVLKLNDGEVMELVKMLGLHATDIPAFCAELNERYDTATCVVTLGERGAFAWSAEEGPLYVPGISVPVVDTVGSGDSFTAAFVSALLDGQGAAEACLRGNLLGALVATKPGGTPQVTQAEVEALRASKAERIRDARLARFEVP